MLDGHDAQGWETDATHAWLGARTTDTEGGLRLHLALPAEGTRTACVLVHDDNWKVVRRVHVKVTAYRDIVPPSALEALAARYLLQVTGPHLPVRVVDGRGEPVTDAWVDIRPREQEGYAPGSGGWSTSSDSDGRTVVHAIVPAEGAQRFRVSASAPDLSPTHHIVEVDADGTVDHGDADLLADDTLAAAIYHVAAEGISRGCGPNTYCHQDTVTRAQMASFLTRALQLEPGDVAPDGA